MQGQWKKVDRMCKDCTSSLIQVNVVSDHGSFTGLPVLPWQTIESVKRKIKGLKDLPFAATELKDMRLSFNGKVLRDDSTVSAVGIMPPSYPFAGCAKIRVAAPGRSRVSSQRAAEEVSWAGGGD